MRRIALLLAGLAACGDAAPVISAQVVLSSALHEETESLSLFAFGPKRSDDIFLVCTTLMAQELEPTDNRIETLSRLDIAFDEAGEREAVLEGIPPGGGRLVFVQAFDSGDALIGLGCEEDILVEEETTTDVEVLVFPL